jgi:uncharacterized protein YkwD
VKRLLVVLMCIGGLIVPVGASAMPPNPAEVDARAELLDLINERRAAKSLPTLVEEAFVDREAYLHSKAMWRSGTVSHAGYRQRVRRVADNDADHEVICENVASAHGVTSAKAAARGVFRFWRSSAAHRRCLDHADTNTAGIGVQRSGSDWYFTFLAVRDATP